MLTTLLRPLVAAAALTLAVLPPAAEACETQEGGKARGYLGVTMSEADGQVTIASVAPGSAAAGAGLEAGDAILEVEGQKVTGPDTVAEAVRSAGPGGILHLRVERDGKTLDRQATLGSRSPFGWHGAHPMPMPGMQGLMRRHFEAPAVRMGVALQPLTEGLRAFFHAPADQGALVSDVSKGSPAEQAGLRPGDILLEVDGRPVASAGDALEALRERKAGDTVPVRVMRDGATSTYDLRLEARPEAETGAFGLPGGEAFAFAVGPEFNLKLDEAMKGLEEHLRDLDGKLPGGAQPRVFRFRQPRDI